MRACRRVDALNPQRAELALFLAPVAVGVLAGLDDRLLGSAKYLAPRVVIPLGLAKDLLVSSTRGDTTFDSCHGEPPAICDWAAAGRYDEHRSRVPGCYRPSAR